MFRLGTGCPGGSSDMRRMGVALLVSFVLHLLPFVPGWISFSKPEPARQIILQATLKPSPVRHVAAATEQPKAPAPPDSGKEKPEIRKVMDGKAPERLPDTDARIVPGASRQPASAPDPVQNESEAMIVPDMGVPVYPPEALGRGLEGCVLAAVHVSPAGEVESVKVLHADVPAVFDQSVIDAHMGANYLPARRNGQSVASRVLAVVDFALRHGQQHRCAWKYAAAAQKINAMPADAAIDAAEIGVLIENH